MKILVTGSKGQLGKTLLARQPDDITIVGVDRDDIDIAEAGEVEALVKHEKPKLIVNAAAYTAVDRAESDEHDARRVNVFGPRNLAATGVRIIHISTDFVFDGEAREPYKPDDATNPLSVYGRSKRDGEIALRELAHDDSIVLRTAWLYSEHGGNFVDTMLRLMRSRDELRVVNDQVGSPTWARSLADVILAMATSDWRPGTYHWTDGGQCSWYDFACAIHNEALHLGLLDKAMAIRAIPSTEYPVPAARPSYSVLDCSSTMAEFDVAQTPWRDNLRSMLEEMS
jgi:dTDP-4-dehydrorhamnose reductase